MVNVVSSDNNKKREKLGERLKKDKKEEYANVLFLMHYMSRRRIICFASPALGVNE